METELEKAFQDYCQWRRDAIEDELSRLRQTLELCESPLERRFLLSALERYGAFPCEWSGLHLLGGISHPDLERFQVRVYPQRSIETAAGQYRADFAVCLTRWDLSSQRTEEYLRLVVEIDGHDFHEKTKEQAQRDRSRDRHLSADGYIVLRFTGSEVYKDPEKVLDEVDDFLVSRASQIFREKGP